MKRTKIAKPCNTIGYSVAFLNAKIGGKGLFGPENGLSMQHYSCNSVVFEYPFRFRDKKAVLLVVLRYLKRKSLRFLY